MKEFKHLNYKNIGIIQTHGLGDALVFLPIIKKIREKFPKAKIHVFTGNDFGKEIFKNIDYIDKVIELDNSISFLNKLKLIFKYFKKYDIFIDTLWGDKLTCLISNIFGKKSIGYKSIGRYKVTISGENPNNFIFVQHNKILQYLNIKEENIAWDFPLKNSHLESLLTKVKIPKSGFICFHPSSKRGFISKRLDLKKTDFIIDYCISLGYKVYLIGSKSDDDFYKNINTRKDLIKVHNIGLSIRETAWLIKKSDIYIGTNSGPMWIATTLGIKSLIINGPSRKCWIPPKNYFPNVYNLNSGYLCNNPQCDNEVCKLNPSGSGLCMENIHNDDIMLTLNKTIDK